MSKEVDALVIIGHSHMMAQYVPSYTHENISGRLSAVRSGNTHWLDGMPVTETETTSLLASEVFVNLGKLASARYVYRQPRPPRYPNPFRDTASDVFDEICPFETGETLPPGYVAKWHGPEPTAQELPAFFGAALRTDASIAAELHEKWELAQAVHARRGNVVIRGYDSSALYKGLGKLDMDSVVPDGVVYYEGLNVVGDSYKLPNLVEEAGVQASDMEFPYYQTLNARENGREILTAALEDLRLVSQAIS